MGNVVSTPTNPSINPSQTNPPTEPSSSQPPVIPIHPPPSASQVPESPRPPIAETNEVSIAAGSSNPGQGQGFVPPSIAIETDTAVKVDE